MIDSTRGKEKVTRIKKVPITIRIPDEVRRQLVRLAKQRGISLNSEIIHAMLAWVDRPAVDELRKVLEDYRKEVQAAKEKGRR
jgi:hypothetical protein